ncbi:MAG: hypothetical protein JW974_03990 [Alphaproteobacteria bacterium]|nr:hypothetical protein [Alphaproteobacteria bacterium]MBN2675149.1 hypothetical protein [Alphaproteobacteria bacterium]
MKKLLFSLIAVFAGVGVASAAGASADPCILIASMQGVFKTLRTLAFVGAGFMIAAWGWGYIKDGKGVDMEDLRKKGTGLLVGFTLLFGIGVVLQFLPGISGCAGMGW